MKKSFSSVLIFVLCVIFPLITLDGYNQLERVKLGCFCLAVTLCFWCRLYERFILWNKENAGAPLRGFLRSLCFPLKAADMAFFAYLFLNLVSFLLSWDKALSFFGYQAEGMGFLFMLLVLEMYLCFKWETEAVNTEKLGKWAVYAGAVLVLFALLQFFGYDVLRLFPPEGSETARRNDFLSTVGNTGLYGVYVNILLAFSLHRFLDRERFAPLWGLSALLFFLGVLTANTDASYLGLAAGICGTFLFSRRKGRSLLRLALFLLCCFLAARGFGLVYRAVPTARNMSALTRKITVPKDKRAGVVPEKEDPDPRSLWERYTAFDDDWGSERGFIWRRLLKVYRDEYTVKEKLVGAGQGTVYGIIMNWYAGEMEQLEAIFTDAHGEAVTLLMTVGALGLVSFVILAFFCIFAHGKAALKGPLMSSLVMALFGIFQPITGVMLWLLITLIAGLPEASPLRKPDPSAPLP